MDRFSTSASLDGGTGRDGVRLSADDEQRWEPEKGRQLSRLDVSNGPAAKAAPSRSGLAADSADPATLGIAALQATL